MKYAFILALGRSGTDFLSRLLNRDPQAAVYHEPYIEDPSIMGLRHSGFDKVVDQMLQTRFKEMTTRSSGHQIHVESNSYLRYEAAWLQQHLDAKVVHLVRDGRTFIRSAYVRDVYTPHDIQQAIVPHNDDPYAEGWEKMSRFEKICWYWQHSNNVLCENIPQCVHMEDLFKDYQVLHESILQPFGLTLSEETWAQEVKRPKNTQRRYLLRRKVRGIIGRAANTKRTELPAYNQWTDEQKKAFSSICGETMERVGYTM